VQQTTIAQRVACNGSGLHSGEKVELALLPAPAQSGIVFVLRGAAADGGDVEIPARSGAVTSTARATTLSRRIETGSGRTENVMINTVEHLLATLFAFAIDNVRIEVSGSEMPVMDGSAAPFVDLVLHAGRRVLSAQRRVVRVVEPLEIRDGNRWIRVEPADSLRISYAIEFSHPCIGRQTMEIADFHEAVFRKEIAAARTFGFVDEVEVLRRAGLAQGGSFENTLVLDDSRILNADRLRWPDEFVRHKVLDLIGDLSLLGAALEGHVRVERGGHSLHHRVVRALAERPQLLEPGVDESAIGPIFGEAAR
jgi:UDP-3-O-[3-hydroxymyristoyl] N-acetylglucosamine deacetylase